MSTDLRGPARQLSGRTAVPWRTMGRDATQRQGRHGMTGGAWLDADEDAAPCSICGRPLTGDPDEIGEDMVGGPMCGDCARTREFDQTIWEWDPDEGG